MKPALAQKGSSGSRRGPSTSMCQLGQMKRTNTTVEGENNSFEEIPLNRYSTEDRESVGKLSTAAESTDDELCRRSRSRREKPFSLW